MQHARFLSITVSVYSTGAGDGGDGFVVYDISRGTVKIHQVEFAVDCHGVLLVSRANKSHCRSRRCHRRAKYHTLDKDARRSSCAAAVVICICLELCKTQTLGRAFLERLLIQFGEVNRWEFPACHLDAAETKHNTRQSG